MTSQQQHTEKADGIVLLNNVSSNTSEHADGRGQDPSEITFPAVPPLLEPSHPASSPSHSSNESEEYELNRKPTEKELEECKHVKNGLSKNVWFVAMLGLSERFAYYGVIVMFQNYIQNPSHDPLRPGALGLGQKVAGIMNNLFTMYTLITPLLAAIIADVWLGRFRTLSVSLCIYMAGLIILITTSTPTPLKHGAGLPGLIVTMLIMGMGVGGVKATIGPFIADQCTDEPHIIKYTKSGQKIIVDRECTVEYIFNIYYWCVNVGSLAAIPTTFMERDINYWVAYLMPSSVFACGIVLFHWNRGNYVIQRPEKKNILPIAFRAMWYGARNGGSMDAARPDFVQLNHGRSVPWSDSFIDELKSGLTATRAFVAFVIYWLCLTQMSTNLISQAANMSTHGIPNDFLPNINAIVVIVVLPIIQHGVYPVLRRCHIPFTPISRITVGFIIEAASMAYVAGIQKLIYSRPPCYSHPRKCADSDGGKIPNDVHVLTQLPVYVLEGLGETFTAPAGYEYAYTKAPQSMKTVVQAAFQLSSGAGSAIAIALAGTYNDPKLLVLFCSLAGCMFLDACIFRFVFRKEVHGLAMRVDEESRSQTKQKDNE